MAKQTVKVKVDRRKLDQLISANKGDAQGWIIHDGVEYGIYQEFGTSRISARPFLVPAFQDSTNDIKKAIGEVIEACGSVNDLFAKIAFDIQRLAQDIITEKHIIDTGALHNSIEVEEK